MNKCAYCATENRDEAIFCRHCRRPLQARQTSRQKSSREVRLWLLVVFILGISATLFLPRSLLSSPATAPISNSNSITGPAPTRAREPVAPSTCVGDSTVRLRRTPGTQSETIGGLVSGMCLTILGRNEEASWVYVMSEDYQTGWVDASLLPDVGDLSRVSIRDDSFMATSARPTLTGAEIAYGAQAYLTKISATNSAGSALSQQVESCFEMVERIGDHISCRVEKAYCDYLPALEGSPTLCSDRPFPDHTFTLIVFGEDWSEYDGQCLIVSGYLEIARGALQIEALNRSQVSSCS